MLELTRRDQMRSACPLPGAILSSGRRFLLQNHNKGNDLILR